MVFVGVLLGAALVAIAAGAEHGIDAAALQAVIVIVTLQIGYAMGFVIRAGTRSLRTDRGMRLERPRSIAGLLGEKRR